MKKYTKYKLVAISITSLFVVSYELIRHYILINYLNKNIDILFSSLLFIVASVIISQLLFNALEKLEIKHYQKAMEAKTMFDNSVDGIFVFTTNGKVLGMNEGAKKLSGWNTIDSLSFEKLFDERISNFSHYKDAQHNNNPHILESYLIRKNGSKLPVSLTLSYIDDYVLRTEKVAVIARDLSERMQMEDVIRKLYAEATQKHYETEILYNISRKMASLRQLRESDYQSIFESVSNNIRKLLSVQDVGIMLRGFDKKEYKLVAHTSKKDKSELTQTFSNFIVEQKGNHCNDFSFTNGMTFIPIQSNSYVMGFIVIQEDEQINWSIHQKELVNSAKQILSITTENIMLYHKLKEVAIIEERERLAREMHDGLAQVISSIHMKIQVLKSLTSDLPVKKNVDVVEVKDVLNELEDITNEAHHEIRQHLFNLRTPFQLHKSLTESLVEYTKLFQKQHGLKINLKINELFKNNEKNLSHDMKIHIIRIIQEALSNIKKHSNASQVTVTVENRKNQGFDFMIIDNGVGFDYQKTKGIKDHYGLEIMEERARIFGGILNIESSRGKGTRVILSIPTVGENNGQN